MTAETCFLCANPDTVVLFRARHDYYESHNAEDEFSCTSLGLSNPGEIRKCLSCGYIFTVQHYSEADVLSRYHDVVDELHLQEKLSRQKTYQQSLELIHRYCSSPGTLLDIGSYVGFFLEVAADSGWDVFGLEPSSWAADYCVSQQRIEQVVNQHLTPEVYPGRKFDVVTMWDVIEHLYDPKEKVAMVNGLLKDGGYFVFSTHNLASRAAQLMGSRYPFLMSMHVSHFTPDSLNYLLTETGFRLVECVPHVRYVSLHYLLHRLRRYVPLLSRVLHGSLTSKFLHQRLVPISFMGLVNVVARKERHL